MASELRHCRRCDKATAHTHVRRNALGEENEGAASRLFFGVISVGISEFLSDHEYECSECGERRS